MNINFSAPFCVFLAAFGAFLSGVSQILLKSQANTTEKESFFKKFLHPKVFLSYVILFLTLAINQVALTKISLSVIPCITATSFIWVFALSALILKEKITKRKVIGVLIIILGVVVSRI